MTAQTAERRRAERWPLAVRQAAARLRREEGLTAAQISHRLKTDHNVVVSRKTVGNWLTQPTAQGQTIGVLARRATSLAEREIDRLERNSKEIDLDRLAKLAAILKALQPLTSPLPKADLQSLGGTGHSQTEGLPLTTLEDLSEAQETEERTPFDAHRT
jgi:transcriptional regulator with XRE-family HTH domain